MRNIIHTLLSHTRAGTQHQQLRSKGAVHVHAHCTEGVTRSKGPRDGIKRRGAGTGTGTGTGAEEEGREEGREEKGRKGKKREEKGRK